MDTAMLRQLWQRRNDANKYDFGHVLVVGGSEGMLGAAFLAAEAALRTGAGLATVASPAAQLEHLERWVKEVMTLQLPPRLSQSPDVVRDFISRRHVNVVVVGPGQAPDFAAMNAAFLQDISVPVVLDGGALGALAGHLDGLQQLAGHNPGIVLTPHIGEFQQLAGQSVPADAASRQQMACDFARTYRVTLALKGHHTIVAHPDGSTYVNTTGNPGMATAGSGDVLSGVVGALLAQGLPLKVAAEGGVYLHGLAGDLAAEAKTQPGMIASDIIAFLPEALLRLHHNT